MVSDFLVIAARRSAEIFEIVDGDLPRLEELSGALDQGKYSTATFKCVGEYSPLSGVSLDGGLSDEKRRHVEKHEEWHRRTNGDGVPLSSLALAESSAIWAEYHAEPGHALALEASGLAQEFLAKRDLEALGRMREIARALGFRSAASRGGGDLATGLFLCPYFSLYSAFSSIADRVAAGSGLPATHPDVEEGVAKVAKEAIAQSDRRGSADVLSRYANVAGTSFMAPYSPMVAMPSLPNWISEREFKEGVDITFDRIYCSKFFRGAP